MRKGLFAILMVFVWSLMAFAVMASLPLWIMALLVVSLVIVIIDGMRPIYASSNEGKLGRLDTKRAEKTVA